MHKTVIFLDLDNTIYPVSSIGDKLFKSLFDLISKNPEYLGDFELIKSEIMRKSFQLIAKEFSFSEKLSHDCINLLNNLTYEDSISPFEDYQEIKEIPTKKYLVTVGFTKLQESKVKQLDIENDFESIFIIDSTISNLTKKEVFQKILNEKGYVINDILVVGDDIDSEIRAGQELGIETILYHRDNEYSQDGDLKTIRSFKELKRYIKL